jgi:hypothetical protein
MSGFSDDRLKEFGANGRARVEAHYDEALVIQKYLAALDELKRAS